MVNILAPPIPKAATLPMWPRCELPDETGHECTRPAKRVILINQFPAAACAPCASYVENERRNHNGRQPTTAAAAGP
jgi:hypothetical protein